MSEILINLIYRFANWLSGVRENKERIAESIPRMSIYATINDNADSNKEILDSRKNTLQFDIIYNLTLKSDSEYTTDNKFFSANKISLDDFKIMVSEGKHLALIWFNTEYAKSSIVITACTVDKTKEKINFAEIPYMEINKNNKIAFVFLKEDFPEALHGTFEEKWIFEYVTNGFVQHSDKRAEVKKAKKKKPR